MTAATRPHVQPWTQRLLQIDRATGALIDGEVADLVRTLAPGDLLVVNDSSTLPASLSSAIEGDPVEVRLAGPPDEGWVVLFGAGDWRVPTEDRPPPPSVHVGRRLEGVGVIVEVATPRLVRVRFDREGVRFWDWLHRVGRPVQYSYMDRPLALPEVQTSYAGRPWAAEMPSAGRPLGAGLRSALVRRGVRLASLTHAAGLSSTGHDETDARLPLPERGDIPERTVAAIREAERVIAVGTSVVRALEDRVERHGRLVPGVETSALRLGPGSPLRVVDGLLSGMHEPGESHFQLMAAFAPVDTLLRAHAHAVDLGYRNHEFGDSTLLL